MRQHPIPHETDKYKGHRYIRGWAYRCIEGRINYQHRDHPFVRMDAVVERFDDSLIGGKDIPLGKGSVTSDVPIVVWIVDTDAWMQFVKPEAVGRGGYHVMYVNKNHTMGGSGHYDTLEEAVKAYDYYRNAVPEQMALL